VNGHLTATRADAGEIRNLLSALDRNAGDSPWINSTKSMIGHALGAAGSIECVATVLQLYHAFVHPSINCEDVNPGLAAVQERIPQSYRPLEMRYALKTSFGFGDVNACAVLGDYRQLNK
jgi:3-oxoacyl-(acyl-carrier-protein) synthase